jgi:hypothetical protein
MLNRLPQVIVGGDAQGEYYRGENVLGDGQLLATGTGSGSGPSGVCRVVNCQSPGPSGFFLFAVGALAIRPLGARVPVLVVPLLSALVASSSGLIRSGCCCRSPPCGPVCCHAGPDCFVPGRDELGGDVVGVLLRLRAREIRHLQHDLVWILLLCRATAVEVRMVAGRRLRWVEHLDAAKTHDVLLVMLSEERVDGRGRPLGV